MKKGKSKNELGDILHLLNLDFNKKEIRNKLNLSKSNLSNYLSKLEKQGYIQRVGKYEVKILRSSLMHPRVTPLPVELKFNKRGHAFNFKVIFPSEENLKEKPEIQKFLLKPSKRQPTILKFGSIRFKYKNNTIWINKNSFTIYSNNSYYSENALHSKFRAIKEVDNLIKHFKSKFGIKGLYGIEVFREHYGLIFNKFAEWLLSKGEKLNVKDKKNTSILWVDDSKEDDIGLKEFEGKNPLDINNANNYFKEHEESNWEVTPKFVLNGLNLLKDNQLNQAKQISEFAVALSKHIPAYEKMGDFTEKLYIEFKKLNERLDKAGL